MTDKVNMAGRPSTSLRPETVAQIKQLRATGMSKRHIAAAVHTAVRKVEEVIRREGLSVSIRAIPRWEGGRADALRAMWNAGASRQELATHFEVSRNSIDNAAKLLKLPKRERIVKPQSAPKPRIRIVERFDALVLDTGRHVTLMDLEGDMCRWPIGDPRHEDFHFCGHKSVEGKSYCEFHRGKSLENPRELQLGVVHKTIPTVWLKGLAA